MGGEGKRGKEEKKAHHSASLSGTFNLSFIDHCRVRAGEGREGRGKKKEKKKKSVFRDHWKLKFAAFPRGGGGKRRRGKKKVNQSMGQRLLAGQSRYCKRNARRQPAEDAVGGGEGRGEEGKKKMPRNVPRIDQWYLRWITPATLYGIGKKKKEKKKKKRKKNRRPIAGDRSTPVFVSCSPSRMTFYAWRQKKRSTCHSLDLLLLFPLLFPASQRLPFSITSGREEGGREEERVTLSRLVSSSFSSSRHLPSSSNTCVLIMMN